MVSADTSQSPLNAHFKHDSKLQKMMEGIWKMQAESPHRSAEIRSFRCRLISLHILKRESSYYQNTVSLSTARPRNPNVVLLM